MDDQRLKPYKHIEGQCKSMCVRLHSSETLQKQPIWRGRVPIPYEINDFRTLENRNLAIIMILERQDAEPLEKQSFRQTRVPKHYKNNSFRKL